MDNNKFVFNLEWYAVLQEYPAEVRFEVYEAIMRYASSGTLSEMKPLAKMAFSFIRKEMDYNRERYESTVEKRREAGRKGGSAKPTEANACDAKQNKQTLAKEANACDAKQNKQKKQMLDLLSINNNDNDNDNELSTTTEGVRERSVVVDVVELETDQRFIESFFADQASIESFCMTNKLSTEQFRRIAEEILTEWRLRGQKHRDEKDARQHLINQARIKINHSRNETVQGDKYSRRRGADSGAVRAEDYTGEI